MSQSPVIKLAEIAMKSQAKGEKFQSQMGSISEPGNMHHLGARLMILPVGKRAWPHHCHHANDEMFVILDGEGTLRFGDDEFPIAAGDVATCPAGGVETAHQIINTGATDLRYIALSSMREPDITEYPDSGKFGAFAGIAPGGDQTLRTFGTFVDASATVGYWDGEADT